MILYKDRLAQIAKEYDPAMIEFAQKIISCPSLSGEEKEVAALELAELKKLKYDDAFIDDYGNVIGVVRGNIPGPVIMYNGHLDHVDIGDSEAWNGYDPYGAVIDEAEMFDETGKKKEKTKVIHGRAASDTKAGHACQIYSGAILRQLRDEGYDMKGNFVYTGAVLEEPAEQIGMKGLLEDTFVKNDIRVDGVVSSEATSLHIYLGHRGRVEMRIEVDGVMSHASAPWLGVNAVNEATKLIDRIAEHFKENYKADEDIGRSSIALTIINCSPGAMSTVPDKCIITYDRRFITGETAESCLQEIEGIIGEVRREHPGFQASVKLNAVPRTTYTGKTVTIPNVKEAYKISKEHPFVKAAASALQELGEPVGYGYWDFGTDLAIVSGKYHIASIGYSPMQEYYCHRPVDMVRIDFMQRAVIGNVALFNKFAALNNKEDFKI